MKTAGCAMLLLLSACGGASGNDVAAEASVAETTDAVTAEAIRDTQAATNDAEAAANVELDQLGLDDDAPAAAAGENKTDRVRNTTAVTVY